MKLRNKKTGEIKSIEEIIRDAFLSNELDSLKSIDTNWEDVDVTNATNIPIIKDEKIRKAIRAWAEANDIEDGITYLDNGEFRSYLNTTIDFAVLVDEHRFDLLKKSEEYTITELCGEEG